MVEDVRLMCRDPLFVDALRSQLSISLARGTTDSVLTNLYSILQIPEMIPLDLANTTQFLYNLIQDRVLTQSILTQGSNE